ncbi:MAG: hypothetical protein ACI3ZD_10020 [Prevotella sp.]
MADNILSDFGINILEEEIDDVIFQTNEFLTDATFTGSQGPFWWLLVVTAFSPFYPLVTNSLSITSDFCLSPLLIRRDKNGTKSEIKYLRTLLSQSSPCGTLLCGCKGTILSRKKRRKVYNSLVLWHFF